MRWSCRLLAAGWLLAARSAAAEEAPITVGGGESRYERTILAEAVESVGGQLETSPEGKTIEEVVIVTLDPIEPRDPLPAALNAAHVRSQRYVIAREVLVQRGEPYRQALVDETARNLRRLPQLSVVLCVPLRGSRADRVRLLVVTKDVWSLFVDFEFTVTNGGLEKLILKPRETNVAGRHLTAYARFQWEPATYALGGGYIVPRLDGQRLALAVDGNVIVNRETQQPEGSYGTFSATRPLFSTHAEWGWLTGVSYRDEVFRRYTNAAVAKIGDVPWQYHARAFSQQLALTRSWGWRSKHDVTAGFELTHREYSSAHAVVAAVMPTGERRVGPYAQWHAYSSDFLRTHDLETLGLQEDVRLGHELWVQAYPVLADLGSSRTFLGVRAAAQYTLPLGDGLTRASVTSMTEAERARLSDASIEARLRVVTPRIGVGRLVFDGMLLNRYRNHLGALSFVGGEGRLRGYPTRALAGSDVLAFNTEYRSRPFELASMQLGVGLFYDVADAFDGASTLHPHHAVGAGLRAVLPQLDRSVLRVDLALPLAGGSPSLFIGFNHAFPLASVGPEPPSPNPTIGRAPQ